MQESYAFPKSEKLCGKLYVKRLYDSGKRMTCYPLRVTWHQEKVDSDLALPQVLVWASKSLFKHAVSRNRLRRQMREAYRLNSEQLKQYCKDNGLLVEIAFNYIAKEQTTYEQIEKAMKKAILKIVSYEQVVS